jgi:predicted RNA-binding Zn ribbon-like protein
MVSNILDGLQLVGGSPCLDFINTEGAVRNGPPERIESYLTLLSWSVLAGVLTEEEAGQGMAITKAKPVLATSVLKRSIELREALYGIFSATVRGEPASAADRAIFDAELAVARSHQRLVPIDDGWGWEFVGAGADAMLWRLAADASDLLTSSDINRVRECSGDTCSWLFVDRSRNRSRRWCDMADCGNRAKARRFYSKNKDAS